MRLAAISMRATRATSRLPTLRPAAALWRTAPALARGDIESGPQWVGARPFSIAVETTNLSF